MKGIKVKKIILFLSLTKGLLAMNDDDIIVKKFIKKVIIENLSMSPFTPNYFETKVNQVFQFLEKKEGGYSFPAGLFNKEQVLFEMDDKILVIYNKIKKHIN